MLWGGEHEGKAVACTYPTSATLGACLAWQLVPRAISHTPKERSVKRANTLFIIVFLAAVMASSCTERDQAWEDAKKTNTIDAYLAYQQSHPKSPHAREGDGTVRSLKWKQATERKSLSNCSRVSPLANFSKMSSTVMRVPATTGLPIITAGSDTIRGAFIGHLSEPAYNDRATETRPSPA
jgi:hypothetical protein